MKNHKEVAQLVKACGKIEGRVKLQKIVHILLENGQPFREVFGYLHHGPYSSELKREIDQLVDWGLVTEGKSQVGDYTQYSYSPNDTLDTALSEMGASSDPEWIQLAQNLNSKSSKDLEAISTIMFLRSRGFVDQRLKQKFASLKPHLKERFDPCLHEAETLKKPTRSAKRRNSPTLCAST